MIMLEYAGERRAKLHDASVVQFLSHILVTVSGNVNEIYIYFRRVLSPLITLVF